MSTEGYDARTAAELSHAIHGVIKPGTMVGTVVGAFEACLGSMLLDFFDPNDPKTLKELEDTLADFGSDTIQFMRRIKAADPSAAIPAADLP